MHPYEARKLVTNKVCDTIRRATMRGLAVSEMRLMLNCDQDYGMGKAAKRIIMQLVDMKQISRVADGADYLLEWLGLPAVKEETPTEEPIEKEEMHSA